MCSRRRRMCRSQRTSLPKAGALVADQPMRAPHTVILPRKAKSEINPGEIIRLPPGASATPKQLSVGSERRYPLRRRHHLSFFHRIFPLLRRIQGKENAVAEKKTSVHFTDEAKNGASPFALGLLTVSGTSPIGGRLCGGRLRGRPGGCRPARRRRRGKMVLRCNQRPSRARARLLLARADLVSANDKIDSLRHELLSLLLSSDRSIVPDYSSVAGIDTPMGTARRKSDTARPELVALQQRRGESIDEARKALLIPPFSDHGGDARLSPRQSWVSRWASTSSSAGGSSASRRAGTCSSTASNPAPRTHSCNGSSTISISPGRERSKPLRRNREAGAHAQLSSARAGLPRVRHRKPRLRRWPGNAKTSLPQGPQPRPIT